MNKIFIFILLLVLVCCNISYSQDIYYNSDFTNETTDIEYERAKNAISNLLIKAPNHILLKNLDKMSEMVKDIVDSAFKARIDWELITSIINFESSFRPHVISNDRQQSIGLMQLHGAAWKYCEDKLGHTINRQNQSDQIICGSIWLRYSIDKCKSIDRGIALYATGYMCNYNKSKSVTSIVKRRMRLYKRLQTEY